MESTDRLNKYLALHLGVSRREADMFISQKRVRIKGEVASLGARVTPQDVVTYNNKPVSSKTSVRYIALHKPVGYVCSRRAQGDNPTIYSLLPADMHALKPVGRLDKNTSGLLLLTNDGEFAFRMTHPKFRKQKTYQATLDTELAPLHQQMINDFGVQLDDGRSQLKLERISDENRKEWTIYMSEGRNRQIRRTFTALGYDVTKLHRTQFGPYSLGELKPGKTQVITP